MIILQPAVIAPQPALDAFGGLIGAGIGIGGGGVGVQRNPGIEMDHAFGAVAEGFPADRDVAGIAAVEILGQDFGHARVYALPQRFTDVDVLA